MIDELADTIATLSLRLTQTPKGSPDYESLSAELSDWLKIFSSWVDEDNYVR